MSDIHDCSLHIIMAGTILTGFRFIGPFHTYEGADRQSNDIDETSWILTLHPPSNLSETSKDDILTKEQIVNFIRDKYGEIPNESS